MKNLNNLPHRLSSLILVLMLVFFSSCEKETLPEEITTANLSSKASVAAQKGDMTIGIMAIENGNFTQLVAALQYTGLADMFVSGTDQYTVFAPTDDAFYELYDILEIQSIEDLPKELVTTVLKYHVTDGRRFSNSVLPKKNKKTIETLAELPFYVNASGEIDTNDEDTASNATIVQPNLSGSNGVIHVINSVLLPE